MGGYSLSWNHRISSNIIHPLFKRFSSRNQSRFTILLAHYAHHKDELLQVHALFSDLRKELLEHFAREEREVFPLMRQPASQEALDKVDALEADHLAAGDIIKQLQAATHDFTAPADGCPTYIATYALLRELTEDIFIHIFKENAILFPKFEKGTN